jgi:hypothetical protein
LVSGLTREMRIDLRYGLPVAMAMERQTQSPTEPL